MPNLKPASCSAHRSDWEFTLIVALFALLPRLFVAIAWPGEPVWDGHYYHFGATRIASGLGYSEDVIIGGELVWKAWCHYPVGYSGFLGALYAVFGQGLLVAPIANALIGAAQVAVVHRLARYFLNENRSRVAAGIAAIHPGLIAYSALVMNELLSGLLVLTGAWLMSRWLNKPKLSASLGGLLFGLGALVRPSILLAAPFTIFLWRKHRFKALLLSGLCVGVACLSVLPWTLRNCSKMDSCAFISTNGGWNLAIGALTETGRFRGLKAEDGCPNIKGQVKQDRCWSQVAREKIAQDPAGWLSLVPKKLAHTYDHESFAIEYLRESDPNTWPEARRVAGRNLLSHFHRGLLFIASLCLIGLPLGGSWASASGQTRRLAWLNQAALFITLCALMAFALYNPAHPFFWLPTCMPLLALLPLPGRPKLGPTGAYLMSLILSTSLTHALFFGDDRYHMVISPILCIFAAAIFRRSARQHTAAEGHQLSH